MNNILDIKNRLTYNTEKDTPAILNINGFHKVTVVVNPENGFLEIKHDTIKYTPRKGYVGTDMFVISGISIKGKIEKSLIIVPVSENIFKPRARLLLHLGDQLIRNESIALVELVKNSYDADASFCNIKMNNVDIKEEGYIVVEDDGSGMDVDTIKNSWLEPGSDNKSKLVERNILSPRFKRLPIGEKGIGRFGAHKLGNYIELVTRRINCDEICVKIDWSEFSKYKYLNEAPIYLYERKPEVFKGNKTGTRITIKDLKINWTRGLVRDVFRAINLIGSPLNFKIKSNGEIVDNTDNMFVSKLLIDREDWIKDIPSWRDIREIALFYFDIEISDEKITKFLYRFIPWDRMTKINKRKVTNEDKPIKDLLELSDPELRKPVPVDLSKFKIGKIKFRGCIFIRDKGLLKIASNQPEFISKYLDVNGGIRIYRDGIRVYDYGEPGNDWLSLDYRRFNNPGVKISNNMIIGAIELERSKSKDLIEKTNREGFIVNDAFNEFRKAILYALRLVEILRRQDKDKVDDFYREPRNRETVLKSLDDLKGIIDKKIKSIDIKKELNVQVDRIEKSYKFMNETLLKTATLGLGWSVYVHEIEKIIIEILKVLNKDKSSDRALKLVNHLSNIIESYAQILRRTNKKEEDLKNIIDQALFNVEFRLDQHEIEVNKEYKNFKSDSSVQISRNLIIGTIMNIIDNSIYWLDRSKKKKKKLYINLSDVKKKYISLIISNNGPEFALPSNEMKEPFVTTKPDGMGLGLHIANEIMLSINGNLTFNEEGELDLPYEFSNGATVVLEFKK
ncbi:MAG: ATP-binding protein [Ignavibacteria bacterium]